MKHALLAAFFAAQALCHGGTGAGTTPPREGTRDRVLFEALALVGTREATGRNDGPVIEAILASTGNVKGDPYCAAFNFYVYQRAGLARLVPRSAWSPAWVARPTWTRAAGGIPPLPGDAFGIWFANRGRVAHTGLVRRWGSVVVTVEANTSPEASSGEADRNGDGIWSKRRLQRQIHSVRNWID